MQLKVKSGVLTSHGPQVPYMIVLHDSAGGTVSGAETTLQQRGLGYHYMIDKDFECYQYASPKVMMYHAMGHNRNTVSISFIGGGNYGYVTDGQIHTCIELINHYILPDTGGNIVQITGHKHLSPGRKVDPRFHGEPPNGVNYEIDAGYMEDIAKATGLNFVTQFCRKDLTNGKKGSTIVGVVGEYTYELQFNVKYKR